MAATQVRANMSASGPSAGTRRRVLVGLGLALALALVLLLAAGAQEARAVPVSQRSTSGGDLISSQPAGDLNNLENLISEFLDDRLKKSKLNSVRQIKQTLRFGRRSDPLMADAALMEDNEQLRGRPMSSFEED